MMIASKLRICFTAATVIAAMALGGAAWAAGDTQAAWEGYATTTASTAQCAGVGGTGGGDTHVSIFRPHITARDTDTLPLGTQTRSRA